MYMKPNKTLVFSNKTMKVRFALGHKLTQNSVDLSFFDWTYQEIQNLTPFIKEWNIQRLVANENYHSQILKEISNIEFPLLQVLILKHNNISSIENIHRIYLPSLIVLDLSQNEQFTKIDPLAKCTLPELQQIHLENTRNQGGNKLIRLSSEKLWLISLDGHKLIGTDDIKWVIRLYAKKMAQIYINNYKRIYQKSIQEKIGQRYEMIHIAPREDYE